jgi:hypothetical protein
MIDLELFDAYRERYNFSNTKSKVMIMNKGSKLSMDSPIWRLGNRNINISNTETHLGIVRPSACKANSTVRTNILKASRTGFP